MDGQQDRPVQVIPNPYHARYEDERHNSTELPRKVVTKNQHEKIMQQQGTSKYNKV